MKSPYQQLTYQITASMESKVQLKTEIHVKRHKLELLRDLAEYSCKRMDSKTWIGSSRFVLNQLRKKAVIIRNIRCMKHTFFIWKKRMSRQEKF